MIVTRSNDRGFSLIELLFAMAIGSMVLILAATMLGSSGDSYEQVGGSVASEREARALMTQLAADMSTAAFHEDGVFEKSSAGWATDRLGFLSLQPAEAQTADGRIGDLCAVNYYVKDMTIAGNTVRCLMRGFRESNETFAALRGDSVASLFDAQPALDEPVAFGVVSFEARPVSRDETGAWSDWVENDTKGPEALDVKLIIARRQLVGRLKQGPDWDGGKLLGSPSEADRNKDLEIYGSRIRFGNHGNL